MPATPSDTFRAWAAATLAADMDTWKLVADDFTYVHSSANLETRSQLIEAFLVNGRRYRGWEIEDLTERRYPGCAVLNGVGHLLGGRPEATPLNVRLTATLVPHGDNWVLAALQTTRLPE
ncbi:MAG: nuclear transport factor 2 family protein [Dehalococcoidia bacterium]